jgi:L-seryl-tRNA(Ser) seleniumtransferase
MSYRALPSVDRLIRTLADNCSLLPRTELVAIARQVLDEARAQIRNGGAVPSIADLTQDVAGRAALALHPRLQPLINATGVIVQTNLGRAPLSSAALQAITTVATGYANLEYDLDAGERGSRYDHMNALLAHLTGAEAALAVNNNAAAVFFVLACFCAGREVIVSRSQAIEIGGGFRIPDVLRESGATLVEVGTTNRTYARDYADVIGERTAAILTVHRSNFQILGFTHDPEDAELAALAHERNILWIDDWGSGSLLQPGDFGLPPEATVSDRVAAGCDLVCFSGDKLLGGPQAGLIVGKATLIARLRKHPLLRALRVDKLTIAAMEATLLTYLRGRATQELPVWRMISAAPKMLQERAMRMVETLLERGIAAEVLSTRSTIGGGSTPGTTLPSAAVALGGGPERLHAALRHGHPPVVGRIADGRLLLDLRTVGADDDARLVAAIAAAYTSEQVAAAPPSAR